MPREAIRVCWESRMEKPIKQEFERHASAFEPTLTEKFSLQIEEKLSEY